MLRLTFFATLALVVACTSSDDTTGLPGTGGGGAGTGGGGAAGGADLPSYDPEPNPLTGEACVADQGKHWIVLAPADCMGKRTCIDAQKRFWVDGKPFLPRGVYNGGYEYQKVIANCPVGEPCEATTPKDAAGFVKLLADGGINLIMDRSRFLKQELLDAIHAEPRMKIAHLLWSDPFTQQGHDDMVADIDAAAADSDVVLWFGPDEIDLNSNWAEAAGIRRLLRGASPELDQLMSSGKYKPAGTPFLPMDEPAHDPHGLPYGAALAFDAGLEDGTDVYDVLYPVTYPFKEPYSIANEGMWGTWRISTYASKGVPMVPVLQMVGIPEIDLWQPTPGQVQAQIMSALAHGKSGSFYYNLTGDKPKMAGRDGWFAPDDTAAWAEFTARHTLEDRLIPVLFSEAVVAGGTHGHLEWRSYELADRRVILIANPTPYARLLDLDVIVQLTNAYVRNYLDCTPFTDRVSVVAPHGSLVLEVHP